MRKTKKRQNMLRIAIASMIVTATANADTQNFEIGDLPACTVAQVNYHNWVSSSANQGLNVYDPDGDSIGHNEADMGFFMVKSWQPVSGNKEAFCGTLHRASYYVYEGIGEIFAGDEHDQNLHIVPSAYGGHGSVISSAVSSGVSEFDSISNCGGKACFEGEIEWGSGYRNNSWFPAINEGTYSSPVTGKAVCVYGPWVGDNAHGGRPEIHPSEAIWWTDPLTPAFGLWKKHVILAQDSSNRFNDSDDFDPENNGHQVWARPRLREKVVVPFHFQQEYGWFPEVFYHIEEPRAAHVSTWTDFPPMIDSGPGNTHSLSYQGVRRVTVVEHQPDSHLGVVFTADQEQNPGKLHNMCRRNDMSVQGFITMKTRLGDAVTQSQVVCDPPLFPYGSGVCHTVNQLVDRPGHQELTITASVSGSLTSAASSESKHENRTDGASVADGRADWTTLQVHRQEENYKLTADLILRLRDSESLESATLGNHRKELKLEKFDKADLPAAAGEDLATSIRVRDVELSAGQSLTLQFGSGAVLAGPAPGLTVLPNLKVHALSADQRGDRKALDIAWKALADRVGASAIARPKNFQFVPAWRANVVPMFAPVKNGKASAEDQSAISSHLNEALTTGNVSALPIDEAVRRAEWTVAGAKQPEIDLVSSRWERVFTFSDPAELQNASVKISIDDVFGHQRNEQVSFWSHALTGESADLTASLPELIAQLANAEGSELFASSATRSDSPLEAKFADRQSKRAPLRWLLQRAVVDGYVTPDELERMVKLAREVVASVSDDSFAESEPK